MTTNELFSCRRLPARLTLEQTALLLGFHTDGIDYLAEIGLIDALGGVPRGVQRMFAAAYVEQLGLDLKWLAKATIKIRQLHQQRNLARKQTQPDRSTIPKPSSLDRPQSDPKPLLDIPGNPSN